MFHSLVALGYSVPYSCVMSVGSLIEGYDESELNMVDMVFLVGSLFCRF